MNEEINRIIGKNLKRIRMSRGITQKRLAGMVGLSYQQISRIEHGFSTSPSRLERLADVLGISVSSLTMEPNHKKKAWQVTKKYLSPDFEAMLASRHLSAVKTSCDEAVKGFQDDMYKIIVDKDAARRYVHELTQKEKQDKYTFSYPQLCAFAQNVMKLFYSDSVAKSIVLDGLKEY